MQRKRTDGFALLMIERTLKNGVRLIVCGRQVREDPRPPDNPNNPFGLLKFPINFNAEIGSLALKPGVQIEMVATASGKQTNELNKNVRWATAYDPDDDLPVPGEYSEMLGVLKNRYCDMVLSTKLAAFLLMTSAMDRDTIMQFAVFGTWKARHSKMFSNWGIQSILGVLIRHVRIRPF
ncbi:hypothetical protein GH714_000271 [Hevea brasiliensis]|uniref:Uncharacterized protein n=1 Tax=Hevea brasiliensis TaxID=3981 RepID=A0A6A6N5S0_HEVBR|nr:hypothetical protein GH714_000271 [Hevea brasiliensis]